MKKKKTQRRKGIRRDVRTKRQEDEEKGRKKRENMESVVSCRHAQEAR